MANENEQKSFWKEKCIGRIPTTLPALYDTDIHDVTDGQILKYDAVKDKWVNGTGGGGGGTGAVTSVNGKTGDVELNASDVGAMPSGTTIGNGTITIKQGGVEKGSFSVNQTSPTEINLEGGGSSGGLTNAYTKIKVGSSTASASGGDTFEFEGGSNVTLSLNNKKLTINSTGGGGGLVLGETPGTAYEGSKGKDLADRIGTLELNSIQKVSDAGDDNIAILNTEGEVEDSEISINSVILKSNTAGLLKNDGTVDTVTKASAQDLLDEVTRATNAESAKVDRLTALFVSGHFASINSIGGIADSGMGISFIQGLQQQIADLYTRIAGFSATLSPSSIVVDSHTDVTITVNCAAAPDEIRVYRQDDPSTTLFTSTSGQTQTVFTDTTVLPTAVGTYQYTIEVDVATNPTTTIIRTLDVTKIPVSLTWSSNSCTAYIGTGVSNTFPTITMSPALSGVTTFRSTDVNVATINGSTGAITLQGAGNCEIWAEYAGDSKHTMAYAYYNLEVRSDYVESLNWNSYTLSPSSPTVGSTATLTKGTVTATYRSGRTVDVTNHPSTRYTATTGILSGTTYTATRAGEDCIRVNYGGKEANFTFTVQQMITDITWVPSSCTVTIGAQNTFPALDNATGLQGITYSSDDSGVATIGGTPQSVTLVSAGTCHITATYAGDDDHFGSSDTYTLTVIDPSPTPPGPTPTVDYYVGWTNGTKSAFAAKSDSDIINGATGYSSSSNPTYTRAFGDNNIFYLLYQTSKQPRSIVFTSGNIPQPLNIVDDNTCPHADIQISGVTYKVFGNRLVTGYDPNDSIEITF